MEKMVELSYEDAIQFIKGAHQGVNQQVMDLRQTQIEYMDPNGKKCAYSIFNLTPILPSPPVPVPILTTPQ